MINVWCFDREIGRIGLDEDRHRSFFQYNPDFLESNLYTNLFPDTGIIKRTKPVQVFSRYNNDTFRGLPPMIADSLPDMFGNIIFRKWLESGNRAYERITVIEQLAYVANRGMGALEYRPGRELPSSATIDLTEIIEVLREVLAQKEETVSAALNNEALLNIFKMGTSAGGVRPKILLSEHKETGEAIPGDINHSAAYDHYLVKLHLDDDEAGYHRERIEYCYYLTAREAGITMMPSKLIEDRHFATLRFDRQHGQKQHILTACGLTGWDYLKPDDSSYENLFELALFLKLPHREIEELFRRMVFNVVFCNTDDHLKNHTFIYHEQENSWHLAPAYDLTYPLNPLLAYRRTSRALSINGKRVDIGLQDVLAVADRYTVKNPKAVIRDMRDAILFWMDTVRAHGIAEGIAERMREGFTPLG